MTGPQCTGVLFLENLREVAWKFRTASDVVSELKSQGTLEYFLMVLKCPFIFDEIYLLN